MVTGHDALTDFELPRSPVAVLLDHFSRLDDDREPERIMYPLSEILFLVTCATICDCDDFDEIVEWGEYHLNFLRKFSEFHVNAGSGFLSIALIPSYLQNALRVGSTLSGPAGMI